MSISTPAAVAVSITLFSVVHAIQKLLSKSRRKAELAQWAKRAVSKRDAKVHKCLEKHAEKKDGGCGDETGEIFHSAVETQRLVCSGKVKPEENLARLARRCLRYGRKKVNGGVNAITEEFYDEEHRIATSMKPIKAGEFAPPLFGVPISIKDCIGLKGSLQTGGLACRTLESQRSSSDSLIVKVLRNAGALPMVRGNVCQLMMLPEAHNFVWGTTKNPWDLSRTPGGSSGGDAALVAMKCVPLAVGSDVAGSCRIPAAFCGVVGFKPSSLRLSQKGSMKPRKNNRMGTTVMIPAVAGPIARNVDDCALFMKSVLVPELFEGDFNVPPVPFDGREFSKTEKLKFGYFETDGWFEPCAAAKRGLRETVNALEQAGHTCIKFDIPTDGWYSYGLLVSINGADGNMRAYVDALDGESAISAYNTLMMAANLPNFLRPILCRLIDKRRSHLLGCARSGGLSVHDFWEKCADLLEMRAAWAQAVLDSGVDCILHPALPLPAVHHGVSGDLTAAFSYTFTANMLLWPAGVVPVTTIREDEQHYRCDQLPINQRDGLAKIAAKVMEDSAGLPMSVAVMAPAYKDELCLRAMKVVEGLMQFDSEASAYK